MTQSINLSASGLVGLGQDAVATLRNALLNDTGENAPGHLQQAGYASGDAVYGAFSAWLGEQDLGAPEDLDVETFAQAASRFFTALGWGGFALSGGYPVAMLDSSDWSEAAGTAGLEHPACHLGTGLLAAFFGRVAEQPLAVMEVECRSAGSSRCRFLLGSADVMQQIWEGMAAGQSYEDALAAPGAAAERV